MSGPLRPGTEPPRRIGRFALLLLVAAVAALLVPALPPTLPDRPTVVLPASGPTAPADLTGSWSTFHGAENRSGFSPANGPTKGSLLWSLIPPTTGAVPIRSGVVVDPRAAYASNAYGTLTAFNRSSNGSSLWQHDLGGAPTAGDLWGPELVVGSSSGTVAALWTSNGSARWSRAVDGGIYQGVSAAGDRVFVGTSNGTVYALNASTGATIWSRPVGAPVAGALAIEGTRVVAATTTGTVVALHTDGTPDWQQSVGETVSCAPSVSAGYVVVGDDAANVSALDLQTGNLSWRFSGRSLLAGDSIQATAAIGLGRVYLNTQGGDVFALWLSNGTLAWHLTTAYAGYAVLSSPALTPNGLYVSDAALEVLDVDPASGVPIWRFPTYFAPAYSDPAVDTGVVYIGSELGMLMALGAPGGPPKYPVVGRVTDPVGTPIVGATIVAARASATTDVNGSFELRLSNGTYTATVTAIRFVTLLTPLVVDGPVGNLTIVLSPVPVVPVSGTVVDARSGRPVANATVNVLGAYGFSNSTTSASDGSFELGAPAGFDFVTVGPPPGFQGMREHLDVPVGGLSGVALAIEPIFPTTGPWGVVLPVAALLAALASVGYWRASQRRVALGLSPRVLSPFAQYVAARLLLVPVQILAILGVLFVFGTMLPSVYYGAQPCQYTQPFCLSGGWSNPLNPPLAFGYGFGHFAWSMFTGDWGYARYGNLVEPATTFLGWWLPNSIELALFALPLSAAIAYFVGLAAGSRRDGVVDAGVRVGSVVGLLVPTFLVVILFLGSFYDVFGRVFGDIPYGFLPSTIWFQAHGGRPPWIGMAETTSPTTLPIVDGLLHGDWPLVELTLVKTLWQALAISLVYVTIFLRFARHAVAEAFDEPHVRAARARGVPESTILWRHTGRRIVPLLLLVFGLTLPIYLGTQAVVEALASDAGVGTLLIAEMTKVTQSGFGFHPSIPGQVLGNLYQVTILLLVIIVLLGNLASDILARYLDPRLLRSRR
ncbi:MAG TPA: PQQ-binding-like beta-propeller repeat protein [Thermoplasmata archaeon]